jgi:hypothetical protein
MHRLVYALLLLLSTRLQAQRSFYKLEIYQLTTSAQETRLHKYLENALLPALHRIGIPQAGVFDAIGNDTVNAKGNNPTARRKVYVLIPFKTMSQYLGLPGNLAKDRQYMTDAKDFLEARFDDTTYSRLETVLLEAFPDAPKVRKPGPFSTPANERIYELRSYESPTEKYFENKVRMFNEGGEIPLFERLGFNAVFYGSVLAGAHMPNLMYMTSFENMQSREDHWKAFNNDAFWKRLVADPQYQHNVSHSDIILLHPTDYSDL